MVPTYRSSRIRFIRAVFYRDPWFLRIHNEILDGLSRLLCLGLDRTPAMDMIQGTAAMWVDALTAGKVWEREFDAPRFRKAFVTLSQTRRQWPAPADFFEAIPPREQLALTKQPMPADPDSPEMKRRFDEIAKVLRIPT